MYHCILFFCVICSVGSNEHCLLSRAKCEQDSECYRELYSLSKCTIFRDCSICKNISRKRLQDFFDADCTCIYGLTISCDDLWEIINKKQCARRNMRKKEDSQYSLTLKNGALTKGLKAKNARQISKKYSHFKISSRRIARSPMLSQIRTWKNELSKGLPKTTNLSSLSCSTALYNICLRHIACRQLWNIFRATCIINNLNQCKMTSREHCWQSYEGISWTGLGNCSCHDTDSDCHWVLLQTRYNKCIYEIGHSEPQSLFLRMHDKERENASISSQEKNYHISKEEANLIQLAAVPFSEPIRLTTKLIPTTEPLTLPFTTQVPQKIMPETHSVYFVRSFQKEKKYNAIHDHCYGKHVQEKSLGETESAVERNDFRSVVQMNRNTSMQNIEAKTSENTDSIATYMSATGEILSKTAPKLSVTPISDHWNIRKTMKKFQKSERINSPSSFMQKNSTNKKVSSCISAYNHCETFDACKWHLSEVQIRCDENKCNRQLCAEAIQRFVSYVSRSVVESLMFCHCDLQDVDCISHQQRLFPKCLYKIDENIPPLTCVEAIEKCHAENRCHRFLSIFFDYCPVNEAQCRLSEFEHCRHALIAVRGTYLEYPCYCFQNDHNCLRYQNAMLPKNPCIEQAMIDYGADIKGNAKKETVNSISHSFNAMNKAVDPGEAKDYSINNEWRSISSSQENNEQSLQSTKDFKSDIGINMHHTSSDKAQPVNAFDARKNSAEKVKAINKIAGTLSHEKTNEHNIYINNDMHSNLADKKANQAKLNRSHKNEITNKYDQKNLYVIDTNNNVMEIINTERSDTTTNEKISNGRTDFDNKTKVNEGSSSSTDYRKYDKNDRQQPFDNLIDVSKPVIVGSIYSDEEKRSTSISDKAKPLAKMKPSLSKSAPKNKMELEETDYNERYQAIKFMNYILPPEGGCASRDFNGNWIIHRKGSTIRRYYDWAGRCSSWCICMENEQLSCTKLPCLDEGNCKAPLSEVAYGERLYIKNRGACTCQLMKFICDEPEKLPKLGPGVYLLIGYSSDEIVMLKEAMPKNVLENAGFVSEDSFVTHDIGSRLQIALEFILPKTTKCKIVLLDEYKESGNIIFQVDWYGKRFGSNETRERWHTGQPEKACSKYIKQLAESISRNNAIRYELVLSTVKQIRVLDLLDALPASSESARRLPNIAIAITAIIYCNLSPLLTIRS